MSATTNHGEGIAEQIQTEDAYGYYDELTNADIWLILDNIQTHLIDTRENCLRDPAFAIVTEALHKLVKLDDDLPL